MSCLTVLVSSVQFHVSFEFVSQVLLNILLTQISSVVFQTGLKENQLRGLDEVYERTYKPKYPVVGYMDYLIKEQSEDIKKRFTNEL